MARYYEANGTNPTYEIIRSFVIDGHEVAWMKFSGTVTFDIMGQGREGQSYDGHALYCECTFTENVGWKVENGQRYTLQGKDNCPVRKHVQELRYQELHAEYVQVHGESLIEHVSEIVDDLKKKARDGEFIEDGNGASFWGGYFYLQSLAAILGIPTREIWDIAEKLESEKKITLEGAVVRDYSEPPAPRWVDGITVEDDGWVGRALLPAHSRMVQEWKLEVLTPEGTPAYENLAGLPMNYSPDFGIDADDFMEAESKLHELIAQAKSAQ